ncbi:MAG: hypothetical protein ACJ76L_12350 [Conexibacter sp.]
MTATVRPVSFSALGRWDAKAAFASRSTGPAVVPFGELARRRREPHEGGLRYGSIHFDGSITLRDASIKLVGKTWVARPGDLVFSKIDARNGAIGVVPEHVGELAFSSEFVVYEIDTERLAREFVALLLRTRTVLAHLDSLAVGHSGRKRLSPQAFEGLTIRSFALPEQQRIAGEHRMLRAKAAEYRAEAGSLVPAAAGNVLQELGVDYVRPTSPPLAFAIPHASTRGWTPRKSAVVLQGVDADLRAAYPVAKLDDVADLQRGVSKSPRNRPGTHATPYIRVANVQPGIVDLTDVQHIDVPPQRLDAVRLVEGDVLVCRNNSLEWVGKAALWKGEIDPCAHDDHVFVVRCKRSRLLPEFLNAYLQTDFARAWFISEAQITTNLAGISGNAVTGLPIPLPPLPLQQALGERYDEARRKAAALLAEAQALETAAADAVEAALRTPTSR